MFRLAQLRFVLLEKITDRRARIHVEIAFVAIPAQRIIGVAQQHVVAVRNAVPAPIQIEIHIETGFQRFVRASPFRHERGFWKFRTNLGKHVLPSANRERFAGVVLLDETVCHVNAEAVRAKRKPESHHVYHRIAGGDRLRAERGLLPCALGMCETVVECRLAFEEVQNVGAVAWRFPADERQAVTAGNPGIRPNVTVGVLVAIHLGAVAEPFVFLAGVAGHEVEDYMHAALVGGCEQGRQIVVGAVAGGDLLVVAHVVARVFEGRIEARVQPDRVAAKVGDVAEFCGDAGNVSDAVAIGVGEGLRIDLVEDRVGEPLWTGVCRRGNHVGVSPWNKRVFRQLLKQS